MAMFAVDIDGQMDNPARAQPKHDLRLVGPAQSNKT